MRPNIAINSKRKINLKIYLVNIPFDPTTQFAMLPSNPINLSYVCSQARTRILFFFVVVLFRSNLCDVIYIASCIVVFLLKCKCTDNNIANCMNLFKRKDKIMIYIMIKHN